MREPMSERSTAWRWWVCGLLLLATMLNYMDRQTLSQSATDISRELGLTNEDYGKLEQGFGLVLVGLLGQRELADQNLPGLGKHPLLARGEASLPLPPPEVADDLGHLQRVAGRELLQVRLVTPRPVGRFLGVGCAQDIEDLCQAFFAYDLADTNYLGILGGHTHRQVTLCNP